MTLPLLLAVDTTTEFGSLALARGAGLIEEIGLHAPNGYGQTLYGAIAALLDRAAAGLGQVDCFAAASGPGTFTGVRIGLACVKGLAEATGKSAVGVSNLEVLAAFGSGPRRAAVLDARRGDVYAAVYDASGQLLGEERVTRFIEWLDSLPDGPIEFVSSDIPLDLSGTRFAGSPVVRAPRMLAAAIARIAHGKWQRGEAHGPEALDANYVRRSDAELLLKP